MRSVFLLSLACCVAPSAQQPPPPDLQLSADAWATAGQPLQLQVDGAHPYEAVYILRGSRPGAGPCFDELGGRCLGLRGPALLAIAEADDQGDVLHAIQVPANVPSGAELHLQAGVVRGWRGANSLLSGVSTVVARTEDCDDGADNDGDGAIDCTDVACAQWPSCTADLDADGWTRLAGDCDDQDPGRYPGAVERCDDVDQDCDDAIDEDFQTAVWTDLDGSERVGLGASCGVSSCAGGTLVCGGGELVCSTHGGRDEEVADGLDNDCNGLIDELHMPTAYWTFDGVDAPGTPFLGRLDCHTEVDGAVGTGMELTYERATITTSPIDQTASEDFTLAFAFKAGPRFSKTGTAFRVLNRLYFFWDHDTVRVYDQDGPRRCTMSTVSEELPAGHLTDGEWHHLALRYEDATQTATVVVDGHTSSALDCDGLDLSFANPRAYFQFGINHIVDGVIDEVAWWGEPLPLPLIGAHARNVLEEGQHYQTNVPDQIPLPGLTPVSPLGVVPTEYPPGHDIGVTDSALNSGLPTVAEQLRQFPDPRYHPETTLQRTCSWVSPEYLAGQLRPHRPGHTEMAALHAIHQPLLSRRFHHMAPLPSLSHYAPGSIFHQGLIDVANTLTDVEACSIVLWPQNIPEAGGTAYIRRFDPTASNALPPEYYLRDAAGNFLGSHFSPEAPIDRWALDAYDPRQGLTAMLPLLTRPLDMVNENGEVYPYEPLRFSTGIQDPTVRAAFQAEVPGVDLDGPTAEADTAEAWAIYTSRAKALWRSTYRDAFMDPSLYDPADQHKLGDFTYYAVTGQRPFEWEEQRSVQSPIPVGAWSGPLSTPDFYPRVPQNWAIRIGPWNGLWEILRGRRIEADAGDSWFAPYVAAGWNHFPEANIRPPQWLGLLKTLGPLGAVSTFPGFFVEVVTPQAPDPADYVWQAVMPAYAQAVSSRYEDVLVEGTEFWRSHTRDPRMAVTVRQHGDRFVIAGALQVTSNDGSDRPGPQTEQVLLAPEPTIDFDCATPLLPRQDWGDWVTLPFRRQGSVYLYDRAAGTMVQLDGWHEDAHPWYWSDTVMLEAELFDASSGATVWTQRPAGATDGDYTEFSSGIDLPAGASASWRLPSTEQMDWSAVVEGVCSAPIRLLLGTDDVAVDCVGGSVPLTTTEADLLHDVDEGPMLTLVNDGPDAVSIDWLRLEPR